MTDNKKSNKNTESNVNNLTAVDKTIERDNRKLLEAYQLKARFRAGSIPLQTDFADLIDVAEMGRRAVGKAEGQTGVADGMQLSFSDRLELKPNVNKAISVDKDGIAVKIQSNAGLNISNQGLGVKHGNGITINNDGISLIPEQTFTRGMLMLYLGRLSNVPKGWIAISNLWDNINVKTISEIIKEYFETTQFNLKEDDDIKLGMDNYHDTDDSKNSDDDIGLLVIIKK